MSLPQTLQCSAYNVTQNWESFVKLVHGRQPLHNYITFHIYMYATQKITIMFDVKGIYIIGLHYRGKSQPLDKILWLFSL